MQPFTTHGEQAGSQGLLPRTLQLGSFLQTHRPRDTAVADQQPQLAGGRSSIGAAAQGFVTLVGQLPQPKQSVMRLLAPSGVEASPSPFFAPSRAFAVGPGVASECSQ